MGVPKRRTSQTKQGTRRSHHTANAPQVVRDPRTGGWKVNHTASLADRDRKGRPLEAPTAPTR
jgi:ribosomal protein L32